MCAEPYRKTREKAGTGAHGRIDRAPSQALQTLRAPRGTRRPGASITSRFTSRFLTTLADGRSFRVIETPERRTAAYRAERERRRTQYCVQLGANRHPRGLDARLAPRWGRVARRRCHAMPE